MVFTSIINFWFSTVLTLCPKCTTKSGENCFWLSLYLKQVPKFFDCVKFSHKVLDPSILYWNPKEDKRLPGMEECLERAKFEPKINHTAVADCLDVIKLLRYVLEY